MGKYTFKLSKTSALGFCIRVYKDMDIPQRTYSKTKEYWQGYIKRLLEAERMYCPGNDDADFVYELNHEDCKAMIQSVLKGLLAHDLA